MIDSQSFSYNVKSDKVIMKTWNKQNQLKTVHYVLRCGPMLIIIFVQILTSSNALSVFSLRQVCADVQYIKVQRCSQLQMMLISF